MTRRQETSEKEKNQEKVSHRKRNRKPRKEIQNRIMSAYEKTTNFGYNIMKIFLANIHEMKRGCSPITTADLAVPTRTKPVATVHERAEDDKVEPDTDELPTRHRSPGARAEAYETEQGTT